MGGRTSRARRASIVQRVAAQVDPSNVDFATVLGRLADARRRQHVPAYTATAAAATRSAQSRFDFISPPSRTRPPRRCGSRRARPAPRRAPPARPSGASKTKKDISSSGTGSRAGSGRASLPRQLLGGRAARRSRAVRSPALAAGEVRLDEVARHASTLRPWCRGENVRTSELCALSAVGVRARCASARRASRRRVSGGLRRSVRRGRARPRPRGSSDLATSSATRRSAAVRPSARVRPPMP